MQKLILSAVMMVWTSTSFGQDFKDELKVGDRMPITELKNMINNSSQTLKFTGPRPKLTILDFWGTTCGACVLAWPKMLALQDEFGKELQIILVDRFEDKKFVKNFVDLRKKKTGVDMSLPISCKDTTLLKYFPRRTVPRYYWIDSNGVLASLTHTDQVTSANIRRWLTTGPFQMDQIVENIHRIVPSKPLFVDGNGGIGRSDAFLWSSSLTRSTGDIIGISNVFASPVTGYGICTTGLNIDGLYRTAYNERLSQAEDFTYLPISRRELIVKDTSKYVGWANGVKTASARYNYQLIADRPMDQQHLQKLMQDDLNRFFGLEVTWETRKRMCLVFTMFDSTKAKAKTRGDYNYIVGETQTWLDNVTMRETISYMEKGSFFYDPRPILDETQFKGLLTGIYFEAYCKDISALDKAFSKFGIHIKEEIRDVDILVLREPETSN